MVDAWTPEEREIWRLWAVIQKLLNERLSMTIEPNSNQTALNVCRSANDPTDILPYCNVLQAVMNEAIRASRKHPPMHSHHEAYAVIKEEFEEYWREVQKGGSTPRNPDALKVELIQTAAMCVRTLHDLCLEEKA